MSKIDVLDQGAEWQRTGETFKLGKAQAVCRFYGCRPADRTCIFSTATRPSAAPDGPHAGLEIGKARVNVPNAAGQCAPALVVPVSGLYNRP
jgi:hypothetical protein